MLTRRAVHHLVVVILYKRRWASSEIAFCISLYILTKNIFLFFSLFDYVYDTNILFLFRFSVCAFYPARASAPPDYVSTLYSTVKEASRWRLSKWIRVCFLLIHFTLVSLFFFVWLTLFFFLCLFLILYFQTFFFGRWGGRGYRSITAATALFYMYIYIQVLWKPSSSLKESKRERERGSRCRGVCIQEVVRNMYVVMRKEGRKEGGEVSTFPFSNAFAPFIFLLRIIFPSHLLYRSDYSQEKKKIYIFRLASFHLNGDGRTKCSTFDLSKMIPNLFLYYRSTSISLKACPTFRWWRLRRYWLLFFSAGNDYIHLERGRKEENAAE